MPPIWVRCGRKESCLCLCNWINVLNCVCMGSSMSVCMYLCMCAFANRYLLNFLRYLSLKSVLEFCIALTIQMLLLRPNAFLRCGLAHRFGQSLACKAVTSSQQPVVDCLPCHSHDEAVFFSSCVAFNYTFIICEYNLIWLCAPRNGPKTHTHAHWN